MDRDLLRTGLGIVVITPGSGFFAVDKKLLRLTTERMYDSGIALDLVCLSKLPLHKSPLFRYRVHPLFIPAQTTSAGTEEHTPSVKELSRSDKIDPLYLDTSSNFMADDQDAQFIYHIPHWIVTSFFHTDFISNPSAILEPSCRLPSGFPWNVTMLDLNKNAPPFLSSEDAENYDDLVFGDVSPARESQLLRDETMSVGRISSTVQMLDKSLPIYTQPTVKPIQIGNPRYSSSAVQIIHGGSVGSALSTSPSCSYKASSYAKSSLFPGRRFDLINPFGDAFGATVISSHLKRWEHLHPLNAKKQIRPVNWTSLCTPACMPLTTDVFPTPSDLDQNYLEYVHTISPYEVGQSDETAQTILREMVGQRLAQGMS